jgi:hypothetical protein
MAVSIDEGSRNPENCWFCDGKTYVKTDDLGVLPLETSIL